MRPVRPVAKLNALPGDDAESLLREVCGSRSWARAVASARPFADAPALHYAAEKAWDELAHADWLEAFAAHPRIGEDRRISGGGASVWARSEQAGVAAAADHQRSELVEAQREYERRFGWPYIVCATGRAASDMLADCRARMARPPDVEIGTAAGEERQIGRLRLVKLLADLEFAADGESIPTGGER